MARIIYLNKYKGVQEKRDQTTLIFSMYQIHMYIENLLYDTLAGYITLTGTTIPM